MAHARARVDRDLDTYGQVLVNALMSLSKLLADQGQLAEAVQAADEAVDIAEGLCDHFGASYHDLSGMAACTLGQRLRDSGRLDDATALFSEAVEIFRAKYPNDPYRHAETLGSVVTEYAGHLIRCRRYEEAVPAAEEALPTRRRPAPR